MKKAFRENKFKVILISLLFFLPVKNIFAQTTMVLKNEEFLRETVKVLLEKAWSDFPQIEPKQISLYPEEKHLANWLIEQELVSFLLTKGFEVHTLIEKPFSSESNSSLHPSDFSLTFRIINLKLAYPKIKGSGILKERKVQREGNVSLYLQLTQSKDNSVLWLKKEEETKTDWISKGELKQVENENYPFFKPEVPSGVKEKLLEPALITAVAGALVYLFFANR
jgi:hypothetical protein